MKLFDMLRSGWWSSYVKPFVRSLRLGSAFWGVSRSRPPASITWQGRRYRLYLPSEATQSWIFRDVILKDEYGLLDTALLSDPPATILDVGANSGLFSLWAGACYPSALIHAYEPSADLQPFLASNLAQVCASVFAEGVHQNYGRGEILVSPETITRRLSVGASGSVSVVPLRECISRLGGHVDLLKLDCEGAEWGILKDKQALAMVKRIRMEYYLLSGAHSLDDLCRMLSGSGLILVKHVSSDAYGMAWFHRA